MIKLVKLVGFCSALAISSAAFAQTNTPVSEPAQDDNATDATGLRDIIVTAQRREQKLNDVGITIVAATGEQLADAGVRSVMDLPRIAPGLTTGTVTAGYPVYSLRGVNFNAGQVAAPPAVSTYIDEAPLPYATMTPNMFFDIERVEVLKGPQGTLFGRNTEGGAISIAHGHDFAGVGRDGAGGAF